MASDPVSRRQFLRESPAAAVAGAIGLGQPSLPRQAWVIVSVNWQNNDEGDYPEGESSIDSGLYYDEKQACADCAEFNANWFAENDPEEFRLEACCSFDDDYEIPEDTSTEDAEARAALWQLLRKAGFPDPYEVVKLAAVPTPPKKAQRE